MIEEPAILTINNSMKRPTATQVEAFRSVPTGFIVDAMTGGGALDGSIRLLGTSPADSTTHIAGPALTANCGPGDILATLAALNYVQSGDIVVSAFAAHQGCASAGDRVTGMMKNGGAVGFVTDGPVRDFSGIMEVGLPVWCTGLTPASPYSSGPGSVGFAVQIGGQEIETGDMIIADYDGVVIVPFEQIDEVLNTLEAVKLAEIDLDAKVANGLKIPEHVAELLASDKTSYKS